MRERKGLLVMDANVLIDFYETDVTVLKLVSDQIGTVHVPTPVLIEEVERIRREDWTALGIVPVEPSIEIAVEAAGRRRGLSFHDWLCLLIAKEAGFTCVTNDMRLRRECEAEGVPVCWGLELLALLVDRAVLTRAAAMLLAEAIHRANPAFIGLKVLERFRKRIGEPSDRSA
jgi:predicted nucleic acid-binding protein